MKQLADSYITINKLEVAFEVMVRGGGGGATGNGPDRMSRDRK